MVPSWCPVAPSAVLFEKFSSTAPIRGAFLSQKMDFPVSFPCPCRDPVDHEFSPLPCWKNIPLAHAFPFAQIVVLPRDASASREGWCPARAEPPARRLRCTRRLRRPSAIQIGPAGVLSAQSSSSRGTPRGCPWPHGRGGLFGRPAALRG